MICSDQHTPRVLGAYGNTVVDTPHMDALASSGCRFDAFYCNNPICAPSRASFMTGRHTFKCEVLDNMDVLDSRLPTLAHIAVRGGYHPVLSGKMHFNGPDQRHGYVERVVGDMGFPGILNGIHRPGRDNPIPAGSLGNCSRPEPLRYTGAGGNTMVDFDHDVTSGATDWLNYYAQAGPGKPPFLLTVGYLLPHCPFIAPREVYDKYEGRVTAEALSPRDLNALHPHHRDYRRYIELDDIPQENFDRAAVAYYGLVDILDQNIGKLCASLRDNGLWDNTIIMYFSDHGEMLGRHGRWHKECFFEDSVRVPMIIRHPTKALPSAVAEPCSLVDLLPTLCDFTGVRPPPGIDGTSLLPLLHGEPAETPRVVKAESYTFWHESTPDLSANRMIRKGPWKLCYYGSYDDFELFNLEEDPGETNDLGHSPAHAEILAELRSLIYEDGWSADVPGKVREKLSAFGWPENLKEYRDTLRKNPLPSDSPDVWRGPSGEATWLEPAHYPKKP